MVEDSEGKYSSIFYVNCNEEEEQKTPFGRITDEQSLKTLKAIMSTPTNEEKKPKIPLIIYQCGEM